MSTARPGEKILVTFISQGIHQRIVADCKERKQTLNRWLLEAVADRMRDATIARWRQQMVEDSRKALHMPKTTGPTAKPSKHLTRQQKKDVANQGRCLVCTCLGGVVDPKRCRIFTCNCHRD
jgi:hypothetical protein